MSKRFMIVLILLSLCFLFSFVNINNNTMIIDIHNPHVLGVNTLLKCRSSFNENWEWKHNLRINKNSTVTISVSKTWKHCEIWTSNIIW